MLRTMAVAAVQLIVNRSLNVMAVVIGFATFPCVPIAAFNAATISLTVQFCSARTRIRFRRMVLFRMILVSYTL